MAGVAIIKIAVAAILLWVVCKINGLIEAKLDEPYGKRTDALFLTTLVLVVGIGIFIVCQVVVIFKPLVIDVFGI